MPSTSSFNSVLSKYRKIAFSEKDKGDRFERLMKAYLLTDPKYVTLFRKVWLWEEFPGRNDLGGNDTGIDLVAVTNEGDYWAIQCKCYLETSIIDKPAVDSFLSTSSRHFKGEDLRTYSFAHRLWISTTNKWGPNAQEAIKNQNPPLSRVNLYDLTNAPVDWEKLDSGITGEVARSDKKKLRSHQVLAVDKAFSYFKSNDRGKLIMACGTGKTFTSLRIAEKETDGKGLILFLVPSIALLGQTLNEWYSDAEEPINAICICSDPEVSRNRKKLDDIDTSSVVDLALPASTNVTNILHQFECLETTSKNGLTVVFSTYQSIDIISTAQKTLEKNNSKYAKFDLIICDEAHRTTGAKLEGADESSFVKVHDNDFIRSKKRLYMTATPRMYSDDIQSRAAQKDIPLWSMDRVDQYGEEIYRIGFGEAVDKDLLTDYKVLILTLNQNDVPPVIQKMIADKESEINTDDASKLIGCINALSKQILGDEGIIKESDPEPMRRAVAFCQSIAVSKKITATFNTASESYVSELPAEAQNSMQLVSSKHIDGTMNATERNDLLGWLKEESEERECRVLTNVRCLSEGVDVPTLDAVLFLSARNSQVDVVQSVGRVMRKAGPEKKYGYIIIPVVVPTNVEADKALDDNERYKVVWTVLNALRAHDDRFNATVNKMELNRKKPSQILVGRPMYEFDEDGNPVPYEEEQAQYDKKNISEQLSLQFQQLQSVVFARMVQKVGDKRYWEQWAKSVAEIAQSQTERITKLIKEDIKHQKAFDSFLKGLHKNINPSITQSEAIEMLSQHIITKPIFDALFENYSFVQNNPMSQSMQKMLDLLEEQSFEKDTQDLSKFYDFVKTNIGSLDNAEAKQKIITRLYDNFFKIAFPKMVEKLGIVYTPIEVVDFVIYSVVDILEREFNRNISEENIHMLDPFTGTGTFITRLLQSGVINSRDLARKYTQEIHCNEIILLAYYIAAVNIENTFHDILPETNTTYVPFDGICLTDTFQLGEFEDGEKLFSEMFPRNSKRVQRQKRTPLRIIFGNPPYSVGQKSANDNAQNQKYDKLDKRIASTYAALAEATNKNSLYNSYMKAFRWSTDRVKGNKSGGIICFVTDGGWIDNNSHVGFRKSIEKEFSKIYVFNLRGDARTQGEVRRREAGNVFGGGSRTPIAITLLVDNPDKKNENAEIFYSDIGDYLDREQKLNLIKGFKSFTNNSLQLRKIIPNEHGDWISKRSDKFYSFHKLEPEIKFNFKSQSFFLTNSPCLQTNRDAWVYSSSRLQLVLRIEKMVEFYNSQVDKYRKSATAKKSVSDLVEKDEKQISWSSSLLQNLERGRKALFEPHKVNISIYRPFQKQLLYLGDKMIHRRGQIEQFFINEKFPNFVICVSGIGGKKENTALICDTIPDLNILDAGTQCFPLYFYEKRNVIQKGFFDAYDIEDYVRRDAISDFIHERAKKQYGKDVTKEDIFYYIYGLLHSKDYRLTFANDLKKMLPRLPLVDDVKDFWTFSKAGRALAELHLNYETVAPFADAKVTGDDGKSYTVEKLRFPKKDQKDTIIYNSKISISNIPEKAYEYIINGKSAIEWIMERYAITMHKECGIVNDPNDWAKETGKPRYIIDLLLSIINVSVQTVDIVKNLPKINF